MSKREAEIVLRHIHRMAAPHVGEPTRDRQLLERFSVHRDEEAFAALLDRYGAMVLGVCRRILHDTHEAEDAFQATFLILARKAGTIRTHQSVGSWLYSVAYHVATRARAAAVRRNELPAHASRQSALDPLAEVSGRELMQVLDDELQRLPEKYRAPLLLCYLEGQTQDEAARRLGWSPQTLRGRVERGRTVLRRRLIRRGFGLPAALAGTLLEQAQTPAATPALLTAQTLRAVMSSSGGPATAVSVHVAALVENGVNALGAAKLKLVVSLVLMLGMLVAGLGAGLPFLRAPEPQTPSSSPAAEPPAARAKGEPRRDRYGDPLPPYALARLGTVRFRHEGEARSLVFSANGKILAALTDGGVIVWDVRTGKEIRRLPELTGDLTVGRLIDFSPDGRILAGPQDSDHVALWDVATGKRLRALAVLPKDNIPEPPGCHLYTIRFSPDGKLLAVGGSNNRSYVLDAVTGAALHHFKDEFINCPTFSPDGKTLAMDVLVRGKPRANEIQIRDVRTSKILRHWQGHSEMTCDIAFSADGKSLAAGGTDRITIWDAATGAARTRIEKKMGQIENLAFTPDGRTLVGGSEADGKVHVWDVATGEERRQLDPKMGVVRSMALSADGKTVAAGAVHNTIRLWDVATGGELCPDPPGHNASVNAVAYSPDGKLLVTAGENRQVWLWDTDTGKAVRQLRLASARSVAFFPDGQRFALLSPGIKFPGKDIHVCDVASGKELFRVPPGDVHWVNALAFSPDGKSLVSAGWKTTGKNDGLCNLNVYDASTGAFRRRFSIAGFGPEALAFSSDGRILAIGGSWDSDSIRLWDPARGEEIVGLRGHEHNVSCVAFSPDGRTLASGSADRTVRLWEVATGKEIAVLKGHTQEVATVAFSPDGRMVASGGVHPVHGGGPHEIRLWDATNGEEIRHFQGHNSGVHSLAFSPDGARLASGLRNGTVLLWGVPTDPRRTRRLTPAEREVLWSDLASEDARRAYAAIHTLTDDPEQTIAFLRVRLLPAPHTETERIRRRIADLDSDKYALREAAMKELAALGELAGPHLRERLGAKPSLEVRKRVEELLSQTKVLHAGEVVRGVRAAALLEQIGTLEARRLLEKLARGAAEARLTREAEASLERLARRPGR